MSNHRDGGRVIVGVKDEDGKLTPLGLSKDDLATWKRDDLADKVAVYAEPSPSFEVEEALYEENRYIVIEVSEFIDIPVICKKSYGDVLDEGACYVRPRRKPETTRIRTQEDMRDLLEMATEKKLRHFLAQAQRVGVSIWSAESDLATYSEQIGDFENRAKQQGLCSSAYWKLVVRPAVFKADRISKIAELERIIRNSFVDLQGWKLPSLLHYEEVARGEDYVFNKSISRDASPELWHLYQSGQFVYYHIMPDNRQPSQPGPVLNAGVAVIWPTLMFEFAARFAGTAVGDEDMHIEVEAGNINGRSLEFQYPYVAFERLTASAQSYSYNRDISRIDLLANARQLALEPARELLGRFGWDPPDDRWMREIQSKYL